jgi:SAM-dependent methyltransferase
MNNVKNYWENQAEQHEEDYRATNPDYYSFTREIQTLKKYLEPDTSVLEYGCGNGYAARQIFETHALESYLGVDYSENMIDVATAAVGSNTLNFALHYETGNVLTHLTEKKYDIVFTDRCLINLANHEEQVRALQNIHNNLKPQGTYLMMECSKKSLSNINTVRRALDLSPIEERWHNYYLDEDKLLEDIQDYYSVEKIDSFASSYFLISRTINAVVGAASGSIDYLSTINKLASQLPSHGDYAPLKLFILKKKNFSLKNE